ncbi:MAG: hypothetical protein CMC08_05025 [Flavobacteriaceae bacterium]|nr:hypothetical protein [Flavobacteriaceae bacterium]
MDSTTTLSEDKKKIETILAELERGDRTICPLPYDGFLFIEHEVPALLVYRQKPKDAGTLRLARSGASYIVMGEDNLPFFKNLLFKITENLADRFGSYFLVELSSGPTNSNAFIIRGPAQKLPVSLDVLKDSLCKIDSRRLDVQLTARVEQSLERPLHEDTDLLDLSEIRRCGGTLISLEVPPVYRNGKGKFFPVYFRQFRNQFTQALHRAVFEFIRVQTTSKLASYHALGKRDIHSEVFKIDRQLTEIESQYQFLLLVAPVNIQSIREIFFETDFSDVEKYHYRLLPVDPDLLKRKLYNLRIDEIDDPALAYLFDEKREEIDQQLTMLKERGSKNFFYSSVRLYKGMQPEVLEAAENILNDIDEDHSQEQRKELDSNAFKELAKQEFEFLRRQDANFNCAVHIRDDVNVMMVSQGELYLPSDYTLTENEASALIQHEIGTHALTYYNGRQQPLSQLSAGLADYDSLQEGLAVLSEYLIDGLSGNRLRLLAGRVIAGNALLAGANFKQMFQLLYSDHDFSKERAFNITSRMFQGGGFLKDIIYLKGLVELRDYLADGGAMEPLLAGKFALKHVTVMQDLTNRGLLVPPKLKPRYLMHDNVTQKLEQLNQGMPLSNLITT